jgi:hypothetical protein
MGCEWKQPDRNKLKKQAKMRHRHENRMPTRHGRKWPVFVNRCVAASVYKPDTEAAELTGEVCFVPKTRFGQLRRT